MKVTFHILDVTERDSETTENCKIIVSKVEAVRAMTVGCLEAKIDTSIGECVGVYEADTKQLIISDCYSSISGFRSGIAALLLVIRSVPSATKITLDNMSKGDLYRRIGFRYVVCAESGPEMEAEPQHVIDLIAKEFDISWPLSFVNAK